MIATGVCARMRGRALICLMLAALALPAPAQEVSDPGAYLAARAAVRDNDFAAGAAWLPLALASDPANPDLLESAIAAQVGLGDLAAAGALADRLHQAGLVSQLAAMVRVERAAQAGDWAAILTLLDSGESAGPMVDGLSRGWALMGKGEVTQAIAAFEAVGGGTLPRSYALYHQALALASVGDFEGAEAIFALPPEAGLGVSQRALAARVQVLSQMDRAAEAIALIDAMPGAAADPLLSAQRARLAAGDSLPFDRIPDATAGLAEVYLSAAAELMGRADDTSVLIFARIANSLAPQDPATILLLGDILGRMKHADLANAAYAQMPQDSPAFLAAELGRAEVLRRARQLEAAAEVLTGLARSHEGEAAVHTALATVLRMQDRKPEAITALDRALALTPDGDARAWYLHYIRGMTQFDLGNWPAAEADLRASLALDPTQPNVLNFLGYSLVERGEKLDEALAMIEDAVAAQPQNGAIVDSLGWVYFRLGRYEEAVQQLERAAELLATDAVINDHLGDAYWAVGRQREARFQWARALSFEPEAAEAERIRRKLEVGLDAVLAEEGAGVTLAGDPPPGGQ